MTQGINFHTRMEAVAMELRDHLVARFRIALRLWDLGQDKGLRLYQLLKEGTCHLVGVRPVGTLLDSRRFAGIQVLVIGRPGGGQSPGLPPAAQATSAAQIGATWRSCSLAFPELRADDGPAAERLQDLDASPAALFCSA